jgi:hypothetical protein
MTADEIVAACGAAWLTNDPDERAGLLETAVAETAIYCSPTATIVGRDAIASCMAEFQASLNGARIEGTSKPRSHNGMSISAGR